jgi:hypothetical protein
MKSKGPIRTEPLRSVGNRSVAGCECAVRVINSGWMLPQIASAWGE